MKKVLILLLLPFFLNAQVGINTTTPDSSSMLDVTATDKGILIPRISIPNLTAAAPVTAPATSLLVYNTNITTGVGFYYWNGTLWTPFTGNVGWSLTGNAGTTPGTNFLGTTGAQDLVIKTNNAEAIRVQNGGNVGIGTTNPTTRLHVDNSAVATTAFLDGFEDNTLAPFTSSGTPWVTTNGAGQFNVGAVGAGSGATGVSWGSSTMNLTVNTPTAGSAYSFRYKVSSESGSDFLRFYVDGVHQNSWSGTVGWSTFNGTLTAGNHTLMWLYSKNGSVNTGEDRAYIDQFSTTLNSGISAVRIVDGLQASGKVLTSDTNGNASWQSINANETITDMQIPICNNYTTGSTGIFTTPINGVSTTVTWTILAKQIKTTTAPFMAERLQVRYDFSPALPFTPNGVFFSPKNDTTSGDIYTINYAAKSQTSITTNICRTDIFASNTTPCWQGQFYFDVFITN